METQAAVPHTTQAVERPHPGVREYVRVAVALAIITALEVGAFYLDMPRALFVGLLLILMFIKFSVVVLWFMHLRFDSRLFMRLFVFGLILAMSVFAVAFALFFGG